MTNGKITLILLGIILIILSFLTPKATTKFGEILTFGILNSKKINLEELKKESAELRIYSGESKSNFSPGFMYSIYPFNLKNEFSVNIGLESGVRPGGSVVNLEGVLIGKTISVSDKSSIIRTIFDPSFELPVYIGKTSVPAMLKGGPSPRITLIPKSSIVDSGEVIYSASKDFPYGMVLGEMGPVKVSDTSVFYEGELKLSYNLSDIRVVYLQND